MAEVQNQDHKTKACMLVTAVPYDKVANGHQSTER